MKKMGFSLALFAALSAGCTSETESSLIKTKAIQADLLISSNGHRTKVNAELNAGDSFGSNIRLSEGDKLYAETGNNRVQLQEDTDILDIDYEGRFSHSIDNALFKIELIRNNEQSASSEVELPLNFRILSPNDNAEIKYNQSVTVLLDGIDSDSKSEFVIDYICDNKQGGTLTGSASDDLEDKSNFTFNLSELQLLDSVNLENYKNCKFDLTVNRYRIGEISDKFATFSRIRAEQTRKIKNISFTF